MQAGKVDASWAMTLRFHWLTCLAGLALAIGGGCGGRATGSSGDGSIGDGAAEPDDALPSGSRPGDGLPREEAPRSGDVGSAPAASAGGSAPVSIGTTSPSPPPVAGDVCALSTSANGDVVVHVQADIERLARCKVIHGALSIQFETDLDLTPLAALRFIEGRLDVSPRVNDADHRLSSLAGLEGLEHVGGLFLVNVDGGLEPLARLSGELPSLLLVGLRTLHDLKALGGLTVKGDVVLDDMNDLESLDGLVVASHLQALNVQRAPRLRALSSIVGLVDLDTLQVGGAVALEELSLPDSLRSVHNVILDDLSGLRTLTELARFSTITSLKVSNMPLLADLGAGASTAASLTELSVIACPSLTRIVPAGGVSALVSVEINDCDGVIDLEGLQASTALQTLFVNSNAALTQLPSFDFAPEQMQRIMVRDNASLLRGASFPNLSVLYYFETPYYGAAELEIIDNPVLESIGDYPRLTSITMLTLENDGALTSVSLPSLASLTWLRVRKNENLSQLLLGASAGLRIVEVADNPNLARLTIGPRDGSLSTLELHGNAALPGDARQRLLDLTDADTELLLE